VAVPYSYEIVREKFGNVKKKVWQWGIAPVPGLDSYEENLDITGGRSKLLSKINEPFGV